MKNVQKSGIMVAGSILVDKINEISVYPKCGELTKIKNISVSVGGCVPNVAIDIKKIYPELSVYAVGKIGADQDGAFVLDTLKENGVKIGLVTSGLYQKAWPEILNAFQTLGMGDPVDFYDAIITAGTAIRKGQSGTLGEIEAKPHPWLYAETAMALGVTDKSRIIGIEDSAAGVMSIRLSGFAALGVAGGNLNQSGMLPFLYDKRENDGLMSLLPTILGK